MPKWTHKLFGKSSKPQDPPVAPQKPAEGTPKEEQLPLPPIQPTPTHVSANDPVQQEEITRSLEANSLYPREVPCRLVVFYNDQHTIHKFIHFEDIQVRWQSKSTARYKDIELCATRLLEDKLEGGSADSTKLYRKSGRCLLLRVQRHDGKETETEVDSLILEKETQWNFVLADLIGRFCSKRENYFVSFRLEIRWEYWSLTIERVQGEKYVKTIRKAVHDKMERNWQGKKFLPRRDLKEIFTESTVRQLIEADMSLKDHSPLCTHLANNGRPLDRQRFTTDVVADATRLLATCVYQDVPLECLHRLMSHGIKESDIPLTEKDFSDDEDPVKVENFLRSQGSFTAHEFLDRSQDHPKNHVPQHHTLKPGIVAPVMFDEARDLIGKGGFGEVFQARIHADHHAFTPNRDVLFAVKRFRPYGDRTEMDFHKEEGILQKLSKKPHENITLHLAAWTQDERFYMIFPLAECNLHEYLRRSTPELNKDFVLWLFGQLKALADALEHIHVQAPLGLGAPNSDKLRVDTKTNRFHAGYHHDLKPENILAFANPNGGRPILKISDFGTAKLDSVLSGSGLLERSQKYSDVNLGDAIYSAPDYAQTGRTSRPYDIWSMGCIFLEVLLWTFGYGGNKLDDFKSDRYKEPNPGMGVIPAFWYRDSVSKQVALKPAVAQKLTLLQGLTENRGVFRNLVGSTTHMLTLRPAERPVAPVVLSDVKAMLMQAETDLEEDPMFYSDIRGPQQLTTSVAAPMTGIYRTHSRTGSIDTRRIDAPHDSSEEQVWQSPPAWDHRQPFSNPGKESKRPSLAVTTHISEPYTNGQPLLTPLDVDGRPVNGHRSRSPSISITRPDGSPAVDSHGWTQPYGDQALMFIGALQEPPTRDDIPTLRRPRSGSSGSMTI